MSLISRWFGGDKGGEVRSAGMSAGGYAVLGAGGAPSSAGVFVSEEGSLRLTAVAAAIRLLSKRCCCNAAVACDIGASRAGRRRSTSIRSIAFCRSRRTRDDGV